MLWDALNDDLSALNPLTVSRVFRAYSDRSAFTIANDERALRGFCNWLERMQLLPSNPMRSRPRTKTGRKPFRQALAKEEISALFKVAAQDKRFKYRLRATLLLFIGHGLCASEVARIRLEDLDLEKAALLVHGKTGNDVIPLTQQTVKAIKMYLRLERKVLWRDPHLFLYDGKPLNQEALSHLVARMAKRAGIERPVSTHLLRYTFATKCIRNGLDAFTVQRLMRHATPAMTTQYIALAVDDLREKSERLTPLAGLKFVD